MIQLLEIKHVDTEKIMEDLRKIGIRVTELQVDIGVDRLTSVVVKGNYETPIDYGEGITWTSVSNLSNPEHV